MKFQYDFKIFETRETADQIYNREQYIMLPNGQYLFVEEWRETMPPKPLLIVEVSGDDIPPEQSVAIARFVSKA